ncbi:tetratricopeptide repeat protein [bacterium]|nr:tetratricopeptide repeat protein [bacterium]
MKIQVLTFAICFATLFANGCASNGSAFGLASNSVQNKPSVQFSIARAHEQEGNLGAALQTYEAMYQADSANASVCHRIAVTKLRMGEISEGITYLMEADALDPNSAEITGDIGYAHIQQGDFELAEQFLRDSLNINPSNKRNVSNLAMAVGYQGKMEECYNVYRTVMTDAEANANLGFIHSQRGETDRSIELYSKALDQDPSLKSAGEALVQMVDINQKVQIAKRSMPQSKVQLASDSYYE